MLTTSQIYLAGESYAGQHIPYIAKAINDRNKEASKAGKKQLPLRGMLIGNGWIDPVNQYPSTMEFVEREGLIQEGTPIYQNLRALDDACKSKLEAPGSKDRINIPACELVMSQFLDLTIDDKRQCYNVYDIRLKDDHPSCGMAWPTDLKDIEPYLQRKDVVKALNINPAKVSGWSECSGNVGGALRSPKSKPAITLLPELIESGINVLLFSGDKDLICNHIGTETLIHNMKWKSGTGFETAPGVWAPRHDWTFENEPAGYYQHARNLTYVLFYNASHMVPYDQPRQTRDMLDRFMNVDIASIGGQPADSRIDGEKLPQTSVGGHPNSTAAEKEEAQRLKDTEMHAYTKSGEAILVVVIIGVTVWGFFIWRSRRSHKGYRGVNRPSMDLGGSVLNRFHNKRSTADVEAADFDEAELDGLNSPEEGHYALGGASDDEEEAHGSHGNK